MTTQIPPVIRKILAALNLHEHEDISQFLHPKLDRLPRPLQMKGMQQAVDMLLQEMEQGTDIIVWGDYDVDGTTGTALLVNFFRELGIEAHWHIPNRLKDGYGLHSTTFKELHAALGCKRFLLITVDCGISNSREVREIIGMGGLVIVTDHHQLPTGELPGCIILNPNQIGCGFGEDRLAGVGVAFYLAAAVRTALEEAGYFREGVNKPNLKEYLGFVALGTISDLVEITRTNRVLVRAGMEVLANSRIAGLSSLIESAGLKGSPLTTEDISFCLGPRLNAAGRLGAADAAVELMTCDNSLAGVKLSKKLENYNEQRKLLCIQNLETALNLMSNQKDVRYSSVVVVGDFHVGVIGIVASKLVEIYRKPTIVFAHATSPEGEKILKGSGRSVPGIHLLECLHACAENIVKYGGHAMAAGLTVSADKFPDFNESFERKVGLERLNMAHAPNPTSLTIECSVDDIMSRNSLDYLLKFEPFGPENERPVFVDQRASVVDCRTIGEGGLHLQLTVRGKYANYRGVGFGLGMKCAEVRRNPQRAISFTPMLNRYKGAADWQLRVVDI